MSMLASPVCRMGINRFSTRPLMDFEISRLLSNSSARALIITERYGFVCGGAFAEYANASQSALVLKPDNASFEQAATVSLAGITALQGLRDKGKIQPGQKVLINGASGGVGTFAVQIAKSFGGDGKIGRG